MLKQMFSRSVSAAWAAGIASLPMLLSNPAHADLGAPFPISVPSKAYAVPKVAVGQEGDAVFVWEVSDGTHDRIVARTRSAAGVLGNLLVLSEQGQNAEFPKVAIDADGDAVIVWSRFDGTNWRAQARRLSKSGDLGGVKTLSAPGQDADDPVVAADADGDAMLAWERFDGTTSRIQARPMSKVGKLGKVRSLSKPGQDCYYPRVAMDADGNALFMWARSDQTYVRLHVRALSRKGVLSKTQLLAEPGQDADYAEMAIDADGDAIFVWEHWDGTYIRVQSQTRSKDGVLGPIRTLSPGGKDSRYPDVAMDAEGDALFVWQRHGASSRIQARAHSKAGILGPVQNLSVNGQDANDARVAVDADGDAAVVWERTDGVKETHLRSISKTGALSLVQVVSNGSTSAYNPEVAMGSDGNTVAVWQQTVATDSYNVFGAAAP